MDYYFNWNIIRELKITKEEYEKLLNWPKCSEEFFTFGFCNFENKKDAQKAVEKLESIVVMNKLVGDQNEI